jgi:hypothetical protein
LQGVGKLGGWLQEFLSLCSSIWKDIFIMIRIIFWGVKEAGLMKKVSAYFAKSGKDILFVSCDCF